MFIGPLGRAAGQGCAQLANLMPPQTSRHKVLFVRRDLASANRSGTQTLNFSSELPVVDARGHFAQVVVT
jgi:hypothetical protein